MSHNPKFTVQSLKDSGLSMQQIQTKLGEIGQSLKQAGQDFNTNVVLPIKEAYDEVREGIDILGEAATAVNTLVDDCLGDTSVESLATATKKFSGNWDKFAEDFNKKYGDASEEQQTNILETFARDNFGDKIFETGSLIKNETPVILGGVSDFQKSVSGIKDVNTKDPIVAAKQIKNNIDKVVNAIKQIDGSLNNVFSCATNQLGIDASALIDLQSKLHNIISNVGSKIPAALPDAYSRLGEGIDILDAGKSFVTAMVSDCHGKTTPESLAKLAMDLDTGWDTFAGKVNTMFRNASGGTQSNVLETFSKTHFGENVFYAGSAIKNEMPGIFGGIADFKNAIAGFGGSYRNPVEAATRIKNGVDKIVNATEKIATSLNNMVKIYRGQGNTNGVQGVPVLDTLSKLHDTKPVKLLNSVLNVGVDGMSTVSDATGVINDLKKGNLKGAIDGIKDTAKSAKKTFDDIKKLGKGQEKRDNKKTEDRKTDKSEKDKENKSNGDKNNIASSDSYVCSGATMKCTCGDKTAKLTVLPSRTVFLTGQPMANISDHLSMVNLAPFGRCRSLGFPATASATAANHGKLTPMPCMHNTPFPWMGGKNDYIVKGNPALLKSSTCSCMWGGIISLITDGQTDTGPTDLNNLPKEKFDQEYQKKGLNTTESVKRAHQDVNFKNSRNETGYMSDEDADLKKSNVNYDRNDSKKKQFGINCATTTTTFMLRKRGYNVTARARNSNDHTDSIAYGLNLYNVWKNPDGSAVSPIMLLDVFNAKVEENGLKDELVKLNEVKDELIRIKKLKELNLKDEENARLEKYENDLKNEYIESRKMFLQLYKEVLMESCKEEGYYTFGLVWESVYLGGGHYTVLKSKKGDNGDTLLTNIEPQTGKPFDNIDKMLENLDIPPDDFDTVLRTDDKIFNEEYNDLFDIYYG